MVEPVLQVRDLVVDFATNYGTLRAVDGISFDVGSGETLGVVGESGSGKSVMMLALLGLLPRAPKQITSGQAFFEGMDLLTSTNRELMGVRGKKIAMIFQDAMTSLNPVRTVGSQISEALRVHDRTLTRAAAKRRATELLELVQVPKPDLRYKQYAHEYSGGMRQRAMIAMAISNGPSVLIADEPTTALDVTIQAGILEVLRIASRETGASTIFISHDLGVVAELADRALVMYSGRIAEEGTVTDIFERTSHPYTLGLLRSVPSSVGDRTRLSPIAGQPPRAGARVTGCQFHPRCQLRNDRAECATVVPMLDEIAPGHRTACHFSDELSTMDERRQPR